MSSVQVTDEKTLLEERIRDNQTCSNGKQTQAEESA
jgi:hypothetical protein